MKHANPNRRLYQILAFTFAFLGLALHPPADSPPTSQPTQVAETPSPGTTPPTPHGFPGAETYIYRDGDPEPMRLHVMKPKGWSADEPRSALIHFFGGGFRKGSPEKSIGWARMASNRGMVGIAPDYRTRDRFNATPAECVADARAALRWVQEHTAELGIDPDRIFVSGNSAGGHLALWTAISATPPGSDPAEAPLAQPAGLILVSAVGDTSPAIPRFAKRMGNHATELSPLQNLDEKMPPILMFHGDADEIVPYDSAVRLHAKLTETGNDVNFVTAPGGSHSFRSKLPGWKEKSQTMIEDFLTEHCAIPAVKNPPSPTSTN